MKTIELKYLFFGGLVLGSAICTAQTVNVGELSIAKGGMMSSVGEFDNTLNGDFVNDGDLSLYSHFNNDGLSGFTAGVTSGMTRMIGINGYQDISGSVLLESYNFEFNNGVALPAFHLSNELRIFGTASFKKGVVDGSTSSGIVVFEDGSGQVDASDESYIEGEVTKKGDQAFRFPVGFQGKYRHLGISAPGNPLDVFSAKHVAENSNALYPHANKANGIDFIDESQYWTLEQLSGKSSVFLSLGWGDDAADSHVYTAPYDEIHIVRWDSVQQRWVDEGGAVDADAKEVVMVVDPLKEYGVFALARVKANLALTCSGKSVEVYNAVSPNDDGHNDYFMITGIESCSENTVEVYNRWGVKVYETTGYNTSGNVFKGISQGRLTVNSGERLPEGTYFYTISLAGAKGKAMRKAGYLYLNY